MSRLNSFKNNKSKEYVAMNKNEKFQAQKRSDKAREARTNQFDKNRDISEIHSDRNGSVKVKPFAKERAQELIEWRKKKDLKKQNKMNKKPFLPSGPGAMNKTSLNSVHKQAATSRSLHNSLTSSSNVKSNSLFHETRHNNPTTSIQSSRVTRSQLRREKDEEPNCTSSLPLPSTKLTFLLDEQDLAWIPENDLGDINLKIRRRSLRFSDVFSKAPRSPFLFRAKQDPLLPARAAHEPTILEDSVEISPISAPIPTVNRNLLGAFSLMEDDTELLTEGLDSETYINTFEIEPMNPPPSARKPSKEVTINEVNISLIITPDPMLSQQVNSTDSQLSEALQKTGIELYSSLLQNTTEDLMSQRDRWQGTLNTLTEACDNIRSAIGNTDLLLNKKFPQYSGLILDATENPGQLDLETRCSDLQGFWDLIQREVEDMQAKYSKLIRLAENGYQAVKSTHKLDRKKPIRKTVPKPKKESTQVPCVTRSSSASLRQQMMRGREQMKEKQIEPGIIMMTQQN